MRARVLGTRDQAIVRTLLSRNPVTNAFTAARVDSGVLWPGSAANLFGAPADHPRHLLHVGSNLVPTIDPNTPWESDEALAAFVEAVGPNRHCQAIVGEAAEVLRFHELLARRWGTAYSRQREVRRRQPLMSCREVVAGLPAAPVSRITMASFESYFAASVAMYTEEVGVDPLLGGGRGSYRAHCQSLVESQRAFGIITDGHVVFKADIGVASGGVCQVQGVWLAPHLRGRRLAAPAMAAATALILQEYDTVTLYVNDFNTRAIRTYARVGYRQVSEFATVLY